MRLTALLPCEKIIRDPAGAASLISVFQEITLNLPAETKLPTNAVLPKEWAVYALWQITDAEMNRAYRQTVEVLWPDGSTFFKQAIAVTSDRPDWMTVVMNLGGFPGGQTGKIAIKVWMDLDGERIDGGIETFFKIGHSIVSDIHPAALPA